MKKCLDNKLGQGKGKIVEKKSKEVRQKEGKMKKKKKKGRWS